MVSKLSNRSPLNADEAIAHLETLLPPGTLNEVKRLVFRCAWQGQGYSQIAEAEGYDADYLREAGASLWRSLSQLTGCKVTKRSFRTLLMQQWPALLERVAKPAAPISAKSATSRVSKSQVTEERTQAASQVNSQAMGQTSRTGGGETESTADLGLQRASATPSDRPRCDCDEAPDVSRFYGREPELEQLRSIIISRDGSSRDGPGGCRLVTLLGMGGMGKTSLAAKIVQELKPEFDCVVWRSLRNAPLLELLVADVVAFLSGQAVVQGGQRQLLQQLRQQRCLLVLDNAETLLKEGANSCYRSGYENYENFFRSLGETAHGSCVLVTSREKLSQLTGGEGARSPVRSLTVEGSPTVAQALAVELALQGSSQERATLCQACGHSPLAIKLMGHTIQELFDGSIADFLQEGVFAFDGVRRLLDEHVHRLAPLEYAVLVWLAINRGWTDLATLQHDLVPAVPKFQLLTALSALRGRSLIEQRHGRYGLQGTVMEYMTEAIISRALQEMSGGLGHWFEAHSEPAATRALDNARAFPLLHSHALMKATAQEYIREGQRALILTPLADYLRQWAGTDNRLREAVQGLLTLLRHHPMGQGGYCAGNLVNLSICAGLDLAGFDCSELTLRQAYLRQATLHNVSLQFAQFVDSTLTQVFGSILCLDFSPDGQFVAFGDALGKIQLWNLATGQLQASYAAVEGRIHCLAFSPNGQCLASGGDQGRLDLWEPSTGQRLAQLKGHSRFVWSLAWGPSGRWLVTGGGDRGLRLWSVASFLPQGDSELTGLPQQEAAADWEEEQDSLLRVIHIPSSWIHAVAVSPQGDLIVSGSSDGALRLWDVATGQYLGVLLGHNRWVCAVTFSPDGKHIASASHDGTVRLWESDSGDLLSVLSGHRGPVSRLAFSPDGQWLISASRDKTLRLWNVEQGTCCRTFTGHRGWIQAMAFSPDGKTLASGGHDKTLRLWDVESGSCLSLIQGHTVNMRCVDWHPEGDRLVSCAGDDSLWFWNVAGIEAVASSAPSAAERPSTSIGTRTHPKVLEKVHQCDHRGLWITRWSPDGREILTASKDHQVRAHQIIARQLGETERLNCDRYRSFRGKSDRTAMDRSIEAQPEPPTSHQGWVCTLRLSPDGERIASGSADHNIHLWERRSGRLLAQLAGHSSRVCTVSFSPDGQFIFSGGADHSIRQWTREGNYVRPLNGHDDWVTAVGASPRGGYLASAGLDSQLKFWNLQTGTCQMSLVHHRRPITDLAWRRDGQQLATCSLDHSIHLWQGAWLEAQLAIAAEATAPRVIEVAQAASAYIQLVGHRATVWSVSFSPDGRRLATASEDGTCKIWDSRTGACLATLLPPGPYEATQLQGSRGLTSAQLDTLHELGAVT